MKKKVLVGLTPGHLLLNRIRFVLRMTNFTKTMTKHIICGNVNKLRLSGKGFGKYSKIPVQRALLGPKNSGRCSQVIVVQGLLELKKGPRSRQVVVRSGSAITSI